MYLSILTMFSLAPRLRVAKKKKKKKKKKKQNEMNK